MASRPHSRSSTTSGRSTNRNSANVSLPPSTAENRSECVKVVVRCRPMSQKELADGHQKIVDVDQARGTIELMSARRKNFSNSNHVEEERRTSIINGNKENIMDSSCELEFDSKERKCFTFDAVYDGDSKQVDIYDEIARPLVDSVLEGFNGAIFAYGQTGTGKTYTMEGIREDSARRGIIPNSFAQIFSHIAQTKDVQYLVRSSYLEIYQEEIRDLLSKDQSKRLELREKPDTGVYVKDLSSFVCKSIKEIEHVMSVGNQNRSVGATNMNEHSSRSHAIFIITVEQAEEGMDGETHIRVGKLNLVDLAGSERQVKTGTVGTRQREAIKINLSLSALGNVISALVDGKSTHVPYRDSKLTRLLQDSLGGNSKTVMIANIGPASYNYDESLTTLRYASRAKNIKNRPKINEDPKDALLREFQQEIDRLKAQLEKRRSRPKTTDSMTSSTSAESNDSNLLGNGLVTMSRSITPHPAAEQLDKLEAKIRAMESKLLQGGKNILDHTNEQEKEILQRRRKLVEQKAREREMKQKIDEEEEAALDLKENYSSLQQEVDLKRKRLRKLYTKFQSVRAEIADLADLHSQERQELEEMQSEQLKELKLKYLIIDHFIPVEDKNALLGRIVLDEDDDENWRILPLDENTAHSHLLNGRPLSYPTARRPVCEYTRKAAAVAVTQNDILRYRHENILEPQLDMPERTTRDYPFSGISSSSIREALEAALQEELEQMEQENEIANTTRLDSVLRRNRSTVNRLKSGRSKTRGNRGSGVTTPSLYSERPITPHHLNHQMYRYSTGLHPQ